MRSLILLMVIVGGAACDASRPPVEDDRTEPFSALAISFDARRGQVEVGGPFAGIEFHESRPVPSRFSFYYPVANSLDLSTDYWKRGDSRPLQVTIRFGDRVDSLAAAQWPYEWTPYRVIFHEEYAGYEASIDYRFAEDLPVVVVQLTVRNRSDRAAELRLDTALEPTLRTSHAYQTRVPDRTAYRDGGRTFVAEFDAPDTGPAQLFVLNAGAAPDTSEQARGNLASFSYAQQLAPDDSLVITQIVGTALLLSGEEARFRAADGWKESVAAYETGIQRHIRDHGYFALDDPELRRTDRLARALLRADRHYLDGKIVPMPAPAEYNFFFTHDLLVTDLGAVYFDTDRVRDDLRYVQSLVEADSVLPHARYWRDSTYVIEPANSDNWNHLWAVILAASYLKHSADTATVAALYPTLEKSIDLMLTNERDGLMYAERPDWWDIGHVYGPRAYLTALTIRALEGFAYVSQALDRGTPEPALRLALADRLRRSLTDVLWDEEAGYLLNGMDSVSVDRHFYNGSLVAAWFDLLEASRRDSLLETARRELLDEQIGIRNAMPADFHALQDVYHFLEGEAGDAYLYLNGGVWPQGTAWYALGLIAAGKVDDARDALERYLSVDGIMNSPNGQPAFYEYRNADPEAPTYGAIDKPTFMWAGGWYLHVLYQLAGVRESAWNLSLSPQLPRGFDNVSYDLASFGATARVSYGGTGTYFRRIRVDGEDSPSAVLTGPAERIDLLRGTPAAPYLAAATARVEDVSWTENGEGLAAEVTGFPGQSVRLEVVSPVPLRRVQVDGVALPPDQVSVQSSGDAYFIRISWRLSEPVATAVVGP